MGLNSPTRCPSGSANMADEPMPGMSVGTRSQPGTTRRELGEQSVSHAGQTARVEVDRYDRGQSVAGGHEPTQLLQAARDLRAHRLR